MHPQSPKLRALADKWAHVPAAERANAQSYLSELCNALGVAAPGPRGSGYEFELPVSTTSRSTGKTTTNFIDLYKKDHFILEAKHVDGVEDRVLGAAYGQVKGYASDIAHAPPPFLMVLNVGRTLLLWDRWDGNYGGVNAARRIDLRTLWERDEQIELLRAVWENPALLDPTVRGRLVTRDVAERLAELSASLERRGFEQERVAKFLIRCVFTMFAEDVGLLQEKPFQTILRDYANDPEEFALAMKDLWDSMDSGKRFGHRKLLRFNGHFFHQAEALPLTREDLRVLLQAAEKEWNEVEPTIFGTLLTRALDPVERHRLGAEYTPREYVQRVVTQTVGVPIRERWTPVAAHVAQLRASGKKRDLAAALRELRQFHKWMRGLRFLDPACGSGNFLYVTLNMVKRIELEVLREIDSITGNPELGIEEVGPWQFHGIEVKPWAREIAELTLWIGYHQFWMEHHKGVNTPEPVLKDTGTLDWRDAVLAWGEIVEVPEKSRPDPTPRIKHPVTGKLVPDPSARLPYSEYRGSRQAAWPQADFIIGNPPYMGNKRMRETFGDGYVEALRNTYPEVPDSADYVMYWWHRAAEEVNAGRSIRVGFITTNSITQSFNRLVVQNAYSKGAEVVWAIPDHPWADEAGTGAAVRVAMTVIEQRPTSAVLVRVDSAGRIISERKARRLNADLSTDADVAVAAQRALGANQGLSSRGFTLVGRGFVLDAQEAEQVKANAPSCASLIRPYRNGRDLMHRPRNVHVVDFGLVSEDEARGCTILYDLLRTRVKPERAGNKRKTYRETWWRFGEPRKEFRDAMRGGGGGCKSIYSN